MLITNKCSSTFVVDNISDSLITCGCESCESCQRAVQTCLAVHGH